MRSDVYVPLTNERASIDFYVAKLNLFHQVLDLGSGSVLLKYNNSDDFHLMLYSSDAEASGKPIFSISVEDCKREFDRLASVNFSDGGGIETLAPGMPPLIEYPLGIFFRMRDPFGNLFAIYEWR